MLESILIDLRRVTLIITLSCFTICTSLSLLLIIQENLNLENNYTFKLVKSSFVIMAVTVPTLLITVVMLGYFSV